MTYAVVLVSWLCMGKKCTEPDPTKAVGVIVPITDCQVHIDGSVTCQLAKKVTASGKVVSLQTTANSG